MSLLHKIKIDQTNSCFDNCQGTKVYIDGEELKGVQSISTLHEIDCFPTVTVTFMVNDIEIVPKFKDNEVDDGK